MSTEPTSRKSISDPDTLNSPVFATNRTRKGLVDSMIRVDHAGEAGAIRIYDGQVRLVFYLVLV